MLIRLTGTVRERALRIIEMQLDVPIEEIKAESQFVDDLGADSLAIVEITLALEEEFDLDFPDEVVDRCVTVGDAVRELEAELARRAS